MEQLRTKLVGLDGRNYKAYKDIQGWDVQYDLFRLRIDHVQGDPFAAPSRLRLFVPLKISHIPPEALENTCRLRATRDFLARSFRRSAHSEREISIDAGRQTVLERTACLVTGDDIEIRFRLELPGRGRRIMGRRAADLLCFRLPDIVEKSLIAPQLDLESLKRHYSAVEDQVTLRHQLIEHKLVAFLADGSSLPRLSGVDDRPLENAVCLKAPSSLRVTLSTPNGGNITGMGIPSGVTLIVGGGFHGKSTLLKAIETGVYDHIPGDGREGVVTEPTAVKIRAEDGRSVAGVDISDFIGSLPGGRVTDSFSTDLASGSTSQAAALVESIEVGAQSILLDEDTSATNFMIRDHRMQTLVAKGSEPITPFLDRVRELWDTFGISTVLVMGGSGDYFDHADTVIQMDSYQPLDVTLKAHSIAGNNPTGRTREIVDSLTRPRCRTLDSASIHPERRPGIVKVGVRGLDTLILGRTDIDLRAVEQFVDPCQVRATGWILSRLARGNQPMVDVIRQIESLIGRLHDSGWDDLTGRPDGDLALPRIAEVMAALNRLRGVCMD